MPKLTTTKYYDVASIWQFAGLGENQLKGRFPELHDFLHCRNLVLEKKHPLPCLLGQQLLSDLLMEDRRVKRHCYWNTLTRHHPAGYRETGRSGKWNEMLKFYLHRCEGAVAQDGNRIGQHRICPERQRYNDRTTMLPKALRGPLKARVRGSTERTS